jgi:hypothetical protein
VKKLKINNMKKIIVILSVLVFFMTSCQKEEPYEPPTYNQIPNPPQTEIPSFAGTTWVLYKYNLFGQLSGYQNTSDTLVFLSNYEMTYQGFPCKYSFRLSSSTYNLTFTEIPIFGTISGFMSGSVVSYGKIEFQRFKNLYTSQEWVIFMKKIK